MYSFCTFIFCILYITSFSVSLDIQCFFKEDKWEIGYINSCHLQNNLNIISSDSEAIMSSSAPNNVNGFYSYDKRMHLIPKGLDKLFPDLLFILIQKGPLKEVHNADLASFTKLKSLSLALNEIEVIEDDLFQNNTELEVISLRNNKIFQIFPKVFDNLSKLKYLILGSNQCTSEQISNDRSAVLTYIDRIKVSCCNVEFLMLCEKLETLKNNSKKIEFGNLMTFKLSHEQFATEFKTSNFSSSYVLNKYVGEFENYLNTSLKWDAMLKNFTNLQNLKELGLENIKSDLKVCQKSIIELKDLLTVEQRENLQSIQNSNKEDNNVPKKIKVIEESLINLKDTAFDAIKILQNELSNSFDHKLSELENKTKIENSERFNKLENAEKCSNNTIDLAFLKIDKANSVMQNNSKAFEERIKALENELKFPSTKAFVRTGLVMNKIANFDEITQKINVIQSEVQREHKSLDEKLKLTEISSKASDAKAIKKMESIDRTVKTLIEGVHEKNENFQTEIKKALRKFDNKLLDQEDLTTECHEKIEKIQNDFKNDLRRTDDKIEHLENALKLNQESIASFRSEVSDIFNKILEKLETSSENVEQIIPERFESRSITEQSYVKSLNEKIKHLEKNFNDLKFEVLGKQRIMCESCDSD